MSDAEAVAEAVARALRLLGRREHSRKELSLKLRQRGFEPSVADEAAAEVAAAGYLSDERFAETFIQSRQRRGQGPLKIRAELGRRGVSSNVIDAALETAAVDWRAVAEGARQKRFGPTPPATTAERARQQRFLAGRGFDGHDCRSLLEP